MRTRGSVKPRIHWSKNLSSGCVVTAYEQLRAHVVEGTTAGVFGLIVLMREGVAAWSHAQAPPMAISHIKDSIAATPIVSDDIHADMICVLANMAMAIPPEVHA